MAQAELGLASPVGAPPQAGRPGGRALVWPGIAFGLALAAYVADVAMHPLDLTFRFFDLNIYNHAGLLVRHAPDGAVHLAFPAWRAVPLHAVRRARVRGRLAAALGGAEVADDRGQLRGDGC